MKYTALFDTLLYLNIVRYVFDLRPHPFRMRPQIKGLSHGLKKCPPDTFLPSLRSGRPFVSLSSGVPKKRPSVKTTSFGTPEGTETLRSRSVKPSRAALTRAAIYCSRPSRYKNNPNPQMWFGLFFSGTPEGTRTPNPRNRNPMLYPLSHRCICFSAKLL